MYSLTAKLSLFEIASAIIKESFYFSLFMKNIILQQYNRLTMV